MILASTLPATEGREMLQLLPHSPRSPICLYTRVILTSYHRCGKHLADRHSINLDVDSTGSQGSIRRHLVGLRKEPVLHRKDLSAV